MENVTKDFGPVGLIVLIAVGIFLLILAILWLIFPWFVYSKLSSIEKNTQKSAQSLELVLATLSASHAAQVKTEENTRAIAQNMRTTSPPIVQ